MGKNPQYINAMKFAMQMELDGHNFYKEKASIFKNEVTKELFNRFSVLELEHYDFIKDQLERYLETEDFKLDKKFLDRDESSIFEIRDKSEHIDTTLVESDVPDLTVLRMAYLIEKDFAEFYRRQIEKVDNIEMKRLFEMLADWEDTHEEIFKSEYDRKVDEYMNLPWGG